MVKEGNQIDNTHDFRELAFAFNKARTDFVVSLTLSSLLRSSNLPVFCLAISGNGAASSLVSTLIDEAVANHMSGISKSSMTTLFGHHETDFGRIRSLRKSIGENGEAYLSQRAQVQNRLTLELINCYLLPDGAIDFDKLLVPSL